ncbi:MAG: hypothetical protein ACUVS2_05745 [Candidatus Flexifilum sp.]|jgi:hypothetical protein
MTDGPYPPSGVPFDRPSASAVPLSARLPQWVRWLLDPFHAVVAASVVVIVGLTIHFVALNGVNVPYLDEWLDSAEIAIATARGQLQPYHFFLQNNEHRQLFTNLISAVLTPLSAWDIRIQMILTILAVIVSFILILDIQRHKSRRAALLIAIPVALLLFSVRQRQIWLWSYLLAWTQGIACLIFGLWAIDRLRIGWGGVAGAIFGAFGVFFSLSYGIVAWLIYPALMLVRGYRKPAHFVVFFAAAIAIVALFFTNYDFSVIGWDGQEQSAGLSLNPIRLGYFLLANLGNPVTPFLNENAPLAAVIGATLLGLLLINARYLWRRQRTLRPFAVWLALALFGLAFCGVIALGRSLPFPETYPFLPLHDRYTPPPSLVWIGLLGLASLATLDALNQGSTGRWLVRLNVGALAAGLLLYSATIFYSPVNGALIDARTVECVRQFPATRNLACHRAYLRGTPLQLIADRMNDLSILQLSIYRGQPPLYTQIIPFYHLTPRIISESVETPAFQFRRLTETYASNVFFQHASSVVEFDVTIPDAAGSIVFQSAVFVDRQNLSDSSVEQDGVRFVVGIRADEGDPLLPIDVTVDPASTPDPVPVQADLSAYRGQPVTIALITEARANLFYDWAMWVDPSIQVRPAAPVR